MKPLLTIAALALTGIAGVAFAQTIDPYTPPPNETYEAGPVYVAQGQYAEPRYMDKDELRFLKREARRACGDKPDSMLDLNRWKDYRQCVFVEMGGQSPYSPYYPYQPYPVDEYAPE